MTEDKKPALSGRRQNSIELKGNIFFDSDNATGDMEDDDGLIEAGCLPAQLLENSMEKTRPDYKAAMERLGKFGKLFLDYKGCPRGATGRLCAPLEDEVLSMDVLTDVDGGRWIPVNEDALRELVGRYKELKAESKEA